MLSRLTIQNYAIISSLEMDIQPGLTIITGETGAGKSILLGALGLALGKRADSKVLNDDDEKCIVEAEFKLENESLKSLFTSEGLDYDDVLICRRELTAGGRSRSFINDTPVSLKLMQEVTGHLIELHHQHDNLALQSKEYQMDVLDTISQSLPLYKEYVSQYTALRTTQNKLQSARDEEHASDRRKEFLQFQIDELNSARMTAGEITSLEASQNMLEHAEAIDQVLSELQSVLSDGHPSIHQQLTALVKQVESIRNVYEPISEIADRIESLRVEVQDLALEAGRLDGPGMSDPNELSRVQTRLNQLYSLIKKYNCKDEEGLIALREEFKAEWETLSSMSDLILSLEQEVIALQKELVAKAKSLSAARMAGAKKLVPEVNKLLKELGMVNAQFNITIDALEEPGPHGMDAITFQFTGNKGSALQPLQDVASGGELSRLSLALKSIYAIQAALPTIIFDEIDTGISGEVAWRMGQLIRGLAQGQQILMITHSPQIAAHATHQYHVSKETRSDRDTSSILRLTADQRIEEIAKMVGGEKPSKEAVSNAKSLIAAVRN